MTLWRTCETPQHELCFSTVLGRFTAPVVLGPCRKQPSLCQCSGSFTTGLPVFQGDSRSCGLQPVSVHRNIAAPFPFHNILAPLGSLLPSSFPIWVLPGYLYSSLCLCSLDAPGHHCSHSHGLCTLLYHPLETLWLPAPWRKRLSCVSVIRWPTTGANRLMIVVNKLCF